MQIAYWVQNVIMFQLRSKSMAVFPLKQNFMPSLQAFTQYTRCQYQPEDNKRTKTNDGIVYIEIYLEILVFVHLLSKFKNKMNLLGLLFILYISIKQNIIFESAHANFQSFLTKTAFKLWQSNTVTFPKCYSGNIVQSYDFTVLWQAGSKRMFKPNLLFSKA